MAGERGYRSSRHLRRSRSYNPGVTSGRRIPVRLVVALSVAAALAVFLLYTSFAGGATDSLRPSQLVSGQYAGKEVQLAGIVKGPLAGDAHAGGLRFTLKDFDGPQTVRVVYTGSVPDVFARRRCSASWSARRRWPSTTSSTRSS